MNDESRRLGPPSFPPRYRASGVLLHVASLPSPYGIGDVGPAALAWVDRLHDAGQSWWQALPLGPTGYGNSPYQSLSSFAYRDSVLSPGVKARVAIEQAFTFGWERYVGMTGRIIGMHTFGASAPLKALQKKFGFEPSQVVTAAKAQLAIGEAARVL